MSMRRTSDLPPIDHNSNALTNDTLIEVFDKQHFPGGSVDGITIPPCDYYDSYKYKVTGLSDDIKIYDTNNDNTPPTIANAKAVHDYVENITASIGSITVSNLCSDVECRYIANINDKPLSAPIAQVVDNFQGNSLCTVAIGSIDGKALHVPTFKIYRNSNNTFVGSNPSLTPDNLIGVISSDNNGHELSLYTLRAVDHVSSTYNDGNGIKIATIFDRISGSWVDSTLKLSTKNIYIPKKLSTDLNTLSINLSTLSIDVYGAGGRPSQESDIEPGILPRLSTLEQMGGGIQFPNYTKNVALGWQNYNSADSSWGNKVVPIAKIKFICDVCLYINANTATGYNYDPDSWLIYNHNGSSTFDYSFRELRQVYIKKGECIFMRGGPKGNNSYQDQNRAFPINVDTRNIIDRYQAFMVGQPFDPRWLQINSLNADWEIIPDSPSTTDPDWNSYRPTFSF